MFNDPSEQIDEGAYLMLLRKLTDAELSESIRKLQSILDMHLKEQAARIETKSARPEE